MTPDLKEFYMSERVFYNSPDGFFHLLLEIEEETIMSMNFCPAQVSSQPSNDLEREIFRQFDLYFTGRSKEFDLPFFATGTVFQLMVWEEVMRIPYGNTLTYKEIAERIANPNAGRAVGKALNKNPVPILIPCHRVIGSKGKLTGYGAGIAIKKKLLELERSNL
jgi:methylated-DNA-[protein]-cysteine S-methyltransferase